MGSYLIPGTVKGETRILTFFTPKSFLFTLVGAVFGVVIFLVLKAIGLGILGGILLAVIALISFIVGAVKVPESNAFRVLKRIGGEHLDDIVLRMIKFNKDKKIYIYERSK